MAKGKEIRKCARCGCSIDEKSRYGHAKVNILWQETDTEFSSSVSHTLEMILCGDCYNKLADMVFSFPNIEEECGA